MIKHKNRRPLPTCGHKTKRRCNPSKLATIPSATREFFVANRPAADNDNVGKRLDAFARSMSTDKISTIALQLVVVKRRANLTAE